ncbi:hypothetical protein Py04_0919 [Pyrococcus sp. ST04]|nr:hypothetical protein Py04_0919 [Pyrococcus sp. ST04]
MIETPAGTAFQFNGSGYVDLSSALPDIQDLKVGSISLFFRFEETNQNVLPILYIGDRKGENMFIVEIGHRGEDNRKLYVTWVENGKPVLCFDSGFNLKPERWYHLFVVVSDEGNTAYLNGRELVGRHYNFGNSGMRFFIADIPNTEIMTAGYGKTADSITPEFLYFRGAVMGLEVYLRPLKAWEVQSLLDEVRQRVRKTQTS